MISCYKFKNKYISILINHYIRILIPNLSKPSLKLKVKVTYIFSIYIKIPFAHNDDNISYHLEVIYTFIRFIRENIKPEDNIINNQSFFHLLKRILLFITCDLSYGNNKHKRELIHLLDDTLYVLSAFDNVLFINFIDYFIANMLDTYIKIFKIKNESGSLVEWVMNRFIDKIVKLNNPIKGEFLGRFKKWFVVMLQMYTVDYSNNFGSNDDEEDSDDGEEEYKFPKWHYTEKVFINIFFEMLPWFSTQPNGIALLSEYIYEGHDFVNDIRWESCYFEDHQDLNYGNKSFFNNVKLHVSIRLLNDTFKDFDGKLITPSWYDQLLSAMKGAIRYELFEGVKTFVNMYKRK